MTAGSNNAFPSLLLTEGTEPSAPAAGKQRLYIDSTSHKLKRTDSSGVDVTVEGMVLLEQHTASTSASLNFTAWYSSVFDDYEIRISNLIPDTGANQAYLRMSTNTGSSYDSGANYAWTDMRIGPAGAATGGTTGTNQIIITGGGNSETLPTTSTKGLCGSFRLCEPANTALHKRLFGQTLFDSTSALLVIGVVAGEYRVTTAVDAFQILMASGNITSGTVRVYGIVK